MSTIVWFEVTTEAIADFRKEHLSRLTTQIESVKRPDTQFEIVAPEVGIPNFDSEHQMVWVREVLNIIKRKQIASRAIVMGCFADVGLREAQSIATVPVTGSGQSCFYAASLLGEHFSVLANERDLIPVLRNNAKTYGVDKFIASWGNLGLSISAMHDREKVKQRVLREANQAKNQASPKAVVLGCTVLAGIASEVQPLIGIPVLDPVSVTFQAAEILAGLHQDQLQLGS